MKVFLGGTCNESSWRDNLIPMLKIDYFNPVVENWTPECQEEEIKQRENCDFCLYVITPLMTGVYSIAEVVDDSNKRPNKTIFCVLEEDRLVDGGTVHFMDHYLKSLNAVKKMVQKNGAKVCDNLIELSIFLNYNH